MLSSEAKKLYWLARFLERAEGTARLLNASSQLYLDMPSTEQISWSPLLDILDSRSAFDSQHPKPTEAQVLQFLAADLGNPGSIISSLRMARENLRTVRDGMPMEIWEYTNDLYNYAVKNLPLTASRNDRAAVFSRIIAGVQQIFGLISTTLSRGNSYTFLQMGWNIERADMTTRILDVQAANLLGDIDGRTTVYENLQWVSLLKSLSGYLMYRMNRRHRVHSAGVLRFLLHNPQFPRSVLFCINQLAREVESLPRSKTVIQSITRLEIWLEHASLRHMALNLSELTPFIDQLQKGLGILHENIDEAWFVPWDVSLGIPPKQAQQQIAYA